MQNLINMVGMLAFQSIFDRFYMANGVLNSYYHLKYGSLLFFKDSMCKTCAFHTVMSRHSFGYYSMGITFKKNCITTGS